MNRRPTGARTRRPVTLDRKRWQQLAQELKFSQLDIARKQADTWRTALGTLTTLLAAVLVVRGRDDVSALSLTFQIVVGTLLALALLLLLTATIWLSRALAGRAGEEIMLDGDVLQEWTRAEVAKVSRALHWAPPMAAVSVVVVAAAVGFTWFAPAPDTATPLVRVTETGAHACGGFIGQTRTELILTAPAGGPAIRFPVTSHLVITPVSSCT